MFPFPCGWWTCTIILFDYFNLSLINSFCIIRFSLLLLINSFNIIWFSLLITHQLLLYYLIIPIIYYASSQFVFIYLFLSLSHISFWMADANAIIISVLLFITHQHFLYYLIITIITLIISVYFIFFFPHIFHFWWLMQMPYIISVLLFVTHEHIITHKHLLMVDAMFISSFFLSRLTFVQFGIHSVVSSYAWFILFYFVLHLLGLHIFHHVHPTL